MSVCHWAIDGVHAPAMEKKKWLIPRKFLLLPITAAIFSHPPSHYFPPSGTLYDYCIALHMEVFDGRVYLPLGI